MAYKYLTKKIIDEKLSNDLKSQIISIGIVLAVVIYYVANREWQTTNPWGFILIMCMISLLEIFLQLPATKKMPIFNSGGPIPLTVYNICLFIVMAFYIPLYSPFIIALATVVFFTVYYSSLYSFMLAAANIIGLVLINTINHGYPDLPHGNLYPYLMVLLGISYIGIVQRAGILNRNVRNELSDAGEKISQEREQLGSLINSIKDSVIATDNNGNIIFYNSTFLKLLNVNEILGGQPFSKIVRLYDNHSNLVDFFSIFVPNSEQQRIQDLHIIDSSNQKKFLSIDISQVNSLIPNQQSTGAIILMRDVTRQKSLDDERDEFVAVTSHELRTPIAIAEGSISVVLNSPDLNQLNPRLKENINQAHAGILELANLVNQLTDLSDIESKNLEVEYQEVDLESILYTMKDIHIDAAKSKGLEIVMNIQENLPKIYTSKIYLNLILENLVANAVNFTDHGKIDIEAHLSEKDNDKIILSIKDSGVGISNSEKDKIFTKFYRAEDYKRKHTKGTGLGLYLTLKIAKVIGGNLWFESELNKGSTFFLEIPYKEIDQNRHR